MKNYLLLLLLLVLAVSCREKATLPKEDEKQDNQTHIEQLHNRIQEFINARRFHEGIRYLDSISQIQPVGQECRMELVVGKARMYQDRKSVV